MVVVAATKPEFGEELVDLILTPEGSSVRRLHVAVPQIAVLLDRVLLDLEEGGICSAVRPFSPALTDPIYGSSTSAIFSNHHAKPSRASDRSCQGEDWL